MNENLQVRAEHNLVPKSSLHQHWTLQETQQSYDISTSQWHRFLNHRLASDCRGSWHMSYMEAIQDYCDQEHIQMIYHSQDSMFYEWDSDDYV